MLSKLYILLYSACLLTLDNSIFAQPTEVLDDWVIENPTITSIEGDKIYFEQILGPSTSANSAVALYTENCETELTSIDPVSVSDYDESNGTGYINSTYTVNINFTKINSQSSIVTIDAETQTPTNAKFCINTRTLVSNVAGENDIVVSDMKTNVNITIDSVKDFSFTADLVSNVIGDSIVQDLDIGNIIPCQCSVSGICLDPGSQVPLKNLETLHLCFSPSANEVVMSNLALSLSTEDKSFSFEAVSFESDGPDANDNFVTIDSSNPQITQVSVLMIYEFFDNDNTGIVADGTAYLEFATSSLAVKRSNAFEPFKMTFTLDGGSVENDDTTSSIWIINLFKDVIDLFDQCLL